MDQFQIMAIDDENPRQFTVQSLGNHWYDIFTDTGERMGSIKIDGEDHEHCETAPCQLDMPILSSIRKNIFLYRILHQDWNLG